jgi:PAS domain S-box-containing protein
MALHTALTLFFSATALIFSTRHGLMDVVAQGPGGRLFRILLPIGITIPAVLGFLKVKLHNLEILADPLGPMLVAVFNIMFVSIYIYILSSYINKEDRKRREVLLILQESEKKYRILFSNMINGFAYHKIILDQHGKPVDYEFLEMNPAFEKLTGLQSTTAVGKMVTQVIPGIENDSFNWIGKYGQVALTGESISFENYSEILKKWFKISAYSPRHGYFATVFEDITTLKENEVRLLELDRLKDEFLSVTTHELKTPLIPIKSQAELLLAGDYGELNREQKDAVAMIFKNEEALNTLSSDVLDIARIKSHKLKLVLEKSDVKIILMEVLENMKDLVKERGLTLSLSPLPEIPLLEIDQARIRQVLMNLLSNATKFTPAGGKIELVVKVEKGFVTISVNDSGIGISAENLVKLFIPYSQIDSSLSRKYRGTGLGLAISKGIIEEHGGKIWAVSEGENKGSSFSFTLPI